MNGMFFIHLANPEIYIPPPTGKETGLFAYRFSTGY